MSAVAPQAPTAPEGSPAALISPLPGGGEPPSAAVQTSEAAAHRRHAHWQHNRWWVGGLLAVWALVTFGVSYHARALNFRFFGWPFSFWVAAQGALLVYLLLVIVYERVMARLDQRYQLDEEG